MELGDDGEDSRLWCNNEESTAESDPHAPPGLSDEQAPQPSPLPADPSIAAPSPLTVAAAAAVASDSDAGDDGAGDVGGDAVSSHESYGFDETEIPCVATPFLPLSTLFVAGRRLLPHECVCVCVVCVFAARALASERRPTDAMRARQRSHAERRRPPR